MSILFNPLPSNILWFSKFQSYCDGFNNKYCKYGQIDIDFPLVIHLKKYSTMSISKSIVKRRMYAIFWSW